MVCDLVGRNFHKICILGKYVEISAAREIIAIDVESTDIDIILKEFVFVWSNKDEKMMRYLLSIYQINQHIDRLIENTHAIVYKNYENLKEPTPFQRTFMLLDRTYMIKENDYLDPRAVEHNGKLLIKCFFLAIAKGSVAGVCWTIMSVALVKGDDTGFIQKLLIPYGNHGPVHGCKQLKGCYSPYALCKEIW